MWRNVKKTKIGFRRNSWRFIFVFLRSVFPKYHEISFEYILFRLFPGNAEGNFFQMQGCELANRGELVILDSFSLGRMGGYMTLRCGIILIIHILSTTHRNQHFLDLCCLCACYGCHFQSTTQVI